LFSQDEISVARLKFDNERNPNYKISEPEYQINFVIHKREPRTDTQPFLRHDPDFFEDCFSFVMGVPSSKLSKKSPEYEEALLKNGYCILYRNRQIAYSSNVPCYVFWNEYCGRYPRLSDKDIFPLPGSLYLYRKKHVARNEQTPDAYLIPKNEYPKNINIEYGTLIFPFTPTQEKYRNTDSNFFHGRNIDIQKIEYDKQGEIRALIEYNPKYMHGSYWEEENNYSITKWYKKGDLLPFYRGRPDITVFYSQTRDNSFRYWPPIVKGEHFALQIKNIVPRDSYPIRDVLGTKGRLIGWMELDPHPILINSEGKLLTAEQMKSIGKYELMLPREEKFRDWFDKNNEYIANAIILHMIKNKKNTGHITLQKKDKTQIEIPIENLSTADRKYLFLEH
jgi:hypothetical protein